MVRNWLIAVAGSLAALFLSTCDGTEALTDISLRLSEHDAEAGEQLVALDLEVWPAEAEACRYLLGWRRDVCGEECTPPPSPAERGLSSQGQARIRRLEDDRWEPLRLDVEGQGPWHLVVSGFNADQAPFLYGCAVVTSEVAAGVSLWRPWCDSTVCSGLFHPACPVEIDCEADPVSDDPDDLRPPTCRALSPIVWSFEQGGVACPPGDEIYFAPCMPARIRCEPNVLEPEIDGVCPVEETDQCDAALSEDLDCDGSVPGPCGECTPGAITDCELWADGSDPTENCTATSTCGDDGLWEACVVGGPGGEVCGGGDEDCDGLSDDVDPDALAHCNEGRSPAEPVADGCGATSGCRCGSGPACSNGRTCCWGSCIDLDVSQDHCGGCGNSCLYGDNGSADDPSGANTALTCCAGDCADTLSSTEHCGGCFQPCSDDASAGNGGYCIDGFCEGSDDAANCDADGTCT